MRPPEEERKHRDLGAYNLFVMKAQNVAGSDVKNHRAFMALIGSFWKARCMPPAAAQHCLTQPVAHSSGAVYRGTATQTHTAGHGARDAG